MVCTKEQAPEQEELLASLDRFSTVETEMEIWKGTSVSRKGSETKNLGGFFQFIL